MFDIANLIWTIPGVIGLWVYNKKLSCRLPQPEGWAYFFTVVIFAAPYYFIVKLSEFLLKHYSSFLSSPEYALLEDVLTHLIGLSLSIVLVVYLARRFAQYKNEDDPSAPDPFYNCCHLWQKKFVFITLKNNKIYLAILLDWTKDSKFKSTIRVLPFYSGYRDEQGSPCWTFEYPDDDSLGEKINPGLVVPQREIVTFSLWSHSEVFKDAPRI